MIERKVENGHFALETYLQKISFHSFNNINSLWNMKRTHSKKNLEINVIEENDR